MRLRGGRVGGSSLMMLLLLKVVLVVMLAVLARVLAFSAAAPVNWRGGVRVSPASPPTAARARILRGPVASRSVRASVNVSAGVTDGSSSSARRRYISSRNGPTIVEDNGAFHPSPAADPGGCLR